MSNPVLKYFQFKVLPMGFSWAPQLAQAIGWSMILFRSHEEELDLLGDERFYDELPDMVRLKDSDGNSVGVIVLWYDNLVICNFSSPVSGC